MSETKKTDSVNEASSVPQVGKKTLRFLGEEQLVQEDLNQPSNYPKSVNTSRAVSDSTRDDEMDIDDMISENQNKFRKIKSIDTFASSSQGEDKLLESTSSPLKRADKSITNSSVQSENDNNDNMSVHFGGLEILEQKEDDFPRFEYEPDEVPAKSILKNDQNRSRNQSFDVRYLKDIEGKMISHDDLSDGQEGENEEEDKSSRKSNNTLLKDSMDGAESNDDNEEDYLEEEEVAKDFRNRMDSEVRFKLVPQVEEQNIEVDLATADSNAGQTTTTGVASSATTPGSQSVQKRNSLLFPAYSILKNSPLVQPSEFRALKNIDKVSHHSQEKSQASSEDNSADKEVDDEDDENSGLPKNNDETDVRFVGDIVFQDKNAYKFKYNPEENPKKPIIKRASINYPTYSGGNTPTNQASQHAELRKKKRMSYDFLTLKNVDGKVLKHWQAEFLEDAQFGTANEDDKIDRDIKFGAVEVCEQIRLGDATIASRSICPQKPILKQLHGRSSSCDFKKSIKNIDGVYIRKKELNSSEEDQKVVHFGEAAAVSEQMNNMLSNTQTDQVAQHSHGHCNLAGQSQTQSTSGSRAYSFNLVRSTQSQQNTTSEDVTKKNDSTVNRDSSQEQTALDEKKSILKRSSSVQIRKPPSMLVSCDESPTTNKRKSTFSNRKIELKDAGNKQDTLTPETFQANWTSIRNDFIESATKFLARIDTNNLSKTFPQGMDGATFNQIIDVLHYRQDNEVMVKSFIESLHNLKNFESLIFGNKHLQDTFQEILDSLLNTNAIDIRQYHGLQSRYILKSTD